MEAIILFILGTVGLAHVIIDGSIMQWFRDGIKNVSAKLAKMLNLDGLKRLGDVVDCYLCCGVWCGFLMGLIWISYNPFKVFACGLAGGFLASFSATVMNYLEAQSIVHMDEKHE
jgi:uncharacterized transporter YbjL